MPFDPTAGPDSGNLATWHTPSGAVLSGSDVTSWPDSSGNSKNLTVKGGTVTLDAGAFTATGADGIRFGNTSYLGSAATILGSAPSYTIYVTVFRDSTPASTTPFVQGISNNRFRFYTSSGNIAARTYGNPTSNQTVFTGSAVDPLNPHVYVMVVDAGTACTLYEDTTELGTGGAENSGLTTKLYVNVNGTSYPGVGSVYGDIIVYGSAHDTATRESITNSLLSDYTGAGGGDPDPEPPPAVAPTAAPADVLIYDSTGSTLKGIVPDVMATSYLEELDGPGGGSLRIAHDNPLLVADSTLLDQRNVVKLRVNSQIVGAWVIRKVDENLVDTEGHAGRILEASGPGLLSWLDDAIVLQEFPSAYGGGVRWFGWGSKQGSWYDETAWARPTRVRKRGLPDLKDPSNRWRKAPKYWPACDPEAWWVWDRTDADTYAPAGWAYFRATLVVAEDETPHTMFVSADNRCDVQVDGEPLTTVRARRAWRNTWSADMELDAGTHTLGFRVKNGGGGAGLIVAVFSFTDPDDDEESGTLELRTGQNGNWRMLAYPDAEPGWTAGEVIADLVAEADARGVAALSGLAGDDFTDTTDTAGTAWDTYVWSFDVGATLTDAFNSLKEYDVDIAVDPDTQELRAWQTRGTDQSDTVVIAAPSHVVAAAESAESRIANALLVADEDGWDTVTDDTSIGVHGRIEAFLNLSSLPSRSASKVASKMLELYALPVEGVTVDHVPGDGTTPWIDFSVGDTVSLPTSGGGFTGRRVKSLSVAVDTGQASPVYAIEVDAISTDLADRLQRLIDRLSRGSGGNLAGKVPAPTGPPGEPVGGVPSGPGGDNDNPYRPADPVISPPTDDPWLTPDDPAIPDDGFGFDEELGVGQVTQNVAQAMADVWLSEFGDPLRLALLTSEPTVYEDSTVSIDGVEHTGTGYARIDVPLSALEAISSGDPGTWGYWTNTPLTFPNNSSGSDWDAVTHLAVFDSGDSTVLGIVELPNSLIVPDGSAAQIPTNYLQLVVDAIS